MKKYSCYGLEKFIQGIDNKKNSCGSKIPHPPPITFLMVRPLGLKRGCQAFLAENVETGTKNRCVIEATHVLPRKLRKD